MANAGRTGTEAKITDKMIVELLGDKGIEYPVRTLFNEVATKDAIRHWADGVGDMNPLWRDEDYAMKTGHGCIVAPPTFLFSVCYRAGRPGMPGIHGMYAGTHWFFHKPVKVNDRITASGGLHDLIEKQGAFGGRSFLQIMFVNYRNQRGELLATLQSRTMRMERDTARKKGKYAELKRHVYTEEELKRIWAGIEAEEIRGAEPRYWEDVEAGEQLRPLAKGPLVVADMVAFKIGWGNQPFMMANEIRYHFFKRHPGAAVLNSLNVPDVPEEVHFETNLATRVGVPGFYDYGPQRIAWLGHLVTNWMGDDGWLVELNADVRRFNIEGDTQWCRGVVERKYQEEDRHMVECRVWAENQRNEVTARGWAKVSLPSRA